MQLWSNRKNRINTDSVSKTNSNSSVYNAEHLSTGIPNSAMVGMMNSEPITSHDSSAPNRTGLPDAMKEKFESRFGLSLDDVRVHRNSDKPAEIGALAYAKGSNIFLGSGQEKHLGHELGHVVQQKAGLVRPTGEIGGQLINYDESLEKKASSLSFVNDISYGSLQIGNSGGAECIQGAFELPLDIIIRFIKLMRELRDQNYVQHSSEDQNVQNANNAQMLNSLKDSNSFQNTSLKDVPQNKDSDKKMVIENGLNFNGSKSPLLSKIPPNSNLHDKQENPEKDKETHNTTTSNNNNYKRKTNELELEVNKKIKTVELSSVKHESTKSGEVGTSNENKLENNENDVDPIKKEPHNMPLNSGRIQESKELEKDMKPHKNEKPKNETGGVPVNNEKLEELNKNENKDEFKKNSDSENEMKDINDKNLMLDSGNSDNEKYDKVFKFENYKFASVNAGMVGSLYFFDKDIIGRMRLPHKTGPKLEIVERTKQYRVPKQKIHEFEKWKSEERKKNGKIKSLDMINRIEKLGGVIINFENGEKITGEEANEEVLVEITETTGKDGNIYALSHVSRGGPEQIKGFEQKHFDTLRQAYYFLDSRDFLEMCFSGKEWNVHQSEYDKALDEAEVESDKLILKAKEEYFEKIRAIRSNYEIKMSEQRNSIMKTISEVNSGSKNYEEEMRKIAIKRKMAEDDYDKENNDAEDEFKKKKKEIKYENYEKKHKDARHERDKKESRHVTKCKNEFIKWVIEEYDMSGILPVNSIEEVEKKENPIEEVEKKKDL